MTEAREAAITSVGPTEHWRPRFHITGERNWINDPNGPIHHDGRYHLFFQASEAEPFWGPPSWGHVSSVDLVRWQRHPHAIEPQLGGPDADGCWSGSMHVVDGRPAMYYTGVVGFDDDRAESVCRAWGSHDLLRWERDVANPLIAGPPAGRVSGYHRDPFLWRDGDGWHMLLGSGTVEGARHGQVLLYDSPDATTWTYAGIFFEAPRRLAGIDLGEHWECPQLIWGDGGASALIFSCQDPSATRPLMHSVAFVGEVSGGQFSGALAGLLDHGDAFYAPAVCTDAHGRTLVWGWLQERLDAEVQRGLSHAGALSVPCAAQIADGTLRLIAVPELAALRGAALPSDGESTTGMVYTAAPQMELLATVAGSARWEVAGDGDERVTISVDADRSVLTVETVDDVVGVHRHEARLLDRERRALRVLVDGSAWEVFVDDERTLSTRCYPARSWHRACLTLDPAGQLMDVGAWALDAEAVA